MPRVSNWPRALSLFLQEKTATPFQWGENDCCLFTCDWLAILTGHYPEPANELRGTYADALSAARVLQARGGVEQITADYCATQHWPEVAPSFAQRGDIAIIPTPHGPALGVVIGARIAHPGPEGLALRPLNEALRAWHIQ